VSKIKVRLGQQVFPYTSIRQAISWWLVVSAIQTRKKNWMIDVKEEDIPKKAYIPLNLPD